MNSELQDVFYSLWAGVALVGVSLSIGVGFRRSGLRSWNTALMWELAGWGLLGLSTSLPGSAPWAFAAALLGCVAVTVSAGEMVTCAAHYTGRRLPRGLTWGAAAIGAAIFLAAGGDQGGRLTWIDFALSGQFAWLAWYVRPRQGDGIGIRWRWLACGTFGVAALTLLGGSLLVLREMIDKSSTLYGAAPFQAWPLINISGSLAFLLAHRDEAEQALRRLATRDGLTGLFNRTTIMGHAEEQLAEGRRGWHPFTVMLVDLDHFKQVNDLHGHPMGDKVLQLFARLLKDNVRPADRAGRHGGEEFLLVLDGGLDAAQAVDRRLRDAFSQACRAELGLDCSFSAGAAVLDREHPETLEALIARADEALYRAKHDGRGRLALAMPQHASPHAVAPDRIATA